MSARDELATRLGLEIHSTSGCDCGLTAFPDMRAVDHVLGSLIANPAPFLDLLLRADPANGLDAPIPPTVLAAAYEALPHQGKGSA